MANLAQLRMLEDLDGILLVDKPAGMPFSTVVKTVKRKFNLVKVGHGGSLDAMASGLLVLLLNGANRHAGAVMGADRAHEGAMRLGLKTNTHDVHGERIGGGAVPGSARLAQLAESALAEFKGDVFQAESRWCSVRKEGSAAYEIADTGPHAPQMVHVYRFSPDLSRAANSADGTDVPFIVKATKGLLVKTLVNDFGDALGCGAALSSLRRTGVGRFRVEDAVPFARLLETETGDFASLVKPLAGAFA